MLGCKLYFVVVFICVSLLVSEAEHLCKPVSFKIFTYFSMFFFVNYLINQIILRKCNSWCSDMWELVEAWVWAAGGGGLHCPPQCMHTWLTFNIWPLVLQQCLEVVVTLCSALAFFAFLAQIRWHCRGSGHRCGVWLHTYCLQKKDML